MDAFPEKVAIVTISRETRKTHEWIVLEAKPVHLQTAGPILSRDLWPAVASCRFLWYTLTVTLFGFEP